MTLELCILILTWNVAAQSPDHRIMLNATEMISEQYCPQRMPNLYVIGLQEVDPNPFIRFLNLFRGNPWKKEISEMLILNNYTIIKTNNMNGLYTMVFVHGKHLDHVEKIDTKKTHTGGFWRAKGASSVRLEFYNTSMTFVNSHLAPHDGGYKQRIEDYHKIWTKHIYKSQWTIFDHDVVFWFGDLNFRLLGNTSACAIQSLIKLNKGNYQGFMDDDELIQARETGKAFHTMTEKTPNFPPTFKYHRGSSRLNLIRRPAWCDRILYYTKKGRSIEVQTLVYTSLQNVKLSDHKPVTGLYLLTIPPVKNGQR